MTTKTKRDYQWYLSEMRELVKSGNLSLTKQDRLNFKRADVERFETEQTKAEARAYQDARSQVRAEMLNGMIERRKTREEIDKDCFDKVATKLQATTNRAYVALQQGDITDNFRRSILQDLQLIAAMPGLQIQEA